MKDRRTECASYIEDGRKDFGEGVGPGRGRGKNAPNWDMSRFGGGRSEMLRFTGVFAYQFVNCAQPAGDDGEGGAGGEP